VNEGIQALLTGVGLVMVLEGLAYSANPDSMKRMMIQALKTPSSTLRRAGLAVLGIGVGIVWLARSLPVSG